MTEGGGRDSEPALAEAGASAVAPSALPPKLYFRIGEVAELVGVEPHVLRYWEREFRSIRPTKSAKGQRVYSRRDVENLMRVRELLYREGFTIAGAKKKLQRIRPGAARRGGRRGGRCVARRASSWWRCARRSRPSSSELGPAPTLTRRPRSE